MKKVSRPVLFAALALMLVLAACTPEEGTPTAVGSPVPDGTAVPDLTVTPTVGTTLTAETETPTTEATATLEATATEDTTATPSIPVAGDVILVECQFCIENVGHALLVFSKTSSFEVITSTADTTADPEMGCKVIDTYNERQVVLCRGPEDTSLTLNICDEGNHCTELVVELQSCANVQASATPTPAAAVPSNTPGASPTDTPAAVPPTATPTP